MKPANTKIRALLDKLERLADPANRGTPDEIEAARRKIQRLNSRFDFSGPAPAATIDIFTGLKRRGYSKRAAHIHTFKAADFDICSCVKWAIEQGTGISCLLRGGDLVAAVTAATAKELAKVASHIAQSFQTLLDQFGRVHGVTAADRSVFVRGLYDGMMNDGRAVGERLPGGAPILAKRGKVKQPAETRTPRMAIHPYTVALSLGRQIRLAAPLEEIKAELQRAIQPALGPGQPDRTEPLHRSERR